MRKLTIILVLLLLLALSAAVGAVDVDDSPAVLARYFPEDVEIFISLRTDEAFIDELDALLASALAKLPPSVAAEIPPVSIREALETGLAESSADAGIDLSRERLRTWIGDYAAFSAPPEDSPGDAERVFFVVANTNTAAAIEFWEEAFANMDDLTYERGEAGDFITFTPVEDSRRPLVAISDEVVLLTLPELFEAERENTLYDNAEFQRMVGGLPADRYNLIGVFDLPALIRAGMNEGDMPDFNMEDLGITAVGLTVLDDRSLAIDLVQPMPGSLLPSLAPVDPEFGRFIPANASLVIHSTNFTALYNLIVEQAAASGEPEASDDIQSMLGMFGIDLEQDILSWTTGNYAVFAGLDLVLLDLVTNPMAQPDLSTFPVNLGLIFEATNPESARLLMQKLSITLSAFTNEEQGIRITDGMIGGVGVTRISVDVPMGMDVMTLNVLIGASDDIFFIATEPAIAGILEGAPGLNTSPVFVEASEYFLSNPSSVLYTDDVGLLVVTVVPLALMGPAIGQTFDNLIEELEQSSGSMYDYPAPQLASYQEEDPTGAVIAALLNILHSSSITTTYTLDGITLSRAVITLEE